MANIVKQVPLVSVILPVFNGGGYLKESIESVLAQSLTCYEFLIIDDCSTDGSWEYIQSVKDDRIIAFRNEKNKGLFFNLNFLINSSKAPLIKLWAQDDIMYPYCLSSMIAIHQQYPELGFSYSGRDIIDEHGALRDINFIDNTPNIVSPDLHARISFFTGSIAGNIANVCISRKALDKVGLFNERMKISADFDMWVRLAKEHDTGFIREKLIKLRDHKSQLSRKESLYIYHVKEDMEVFRNLLSYVNPSLQKEGKNLLRKYKFVFYYTLMGKEFLKGRWISAYSYYKEISSMDNFLLLSLSFMRGKIRKPRKPAFLN